MIKIPDYNLGRASGEIRITADTRGAAEAQAAMASTAAEAKALDASMGRVNDTLDKHARANVTSASSIQRHRQQVEDLRITYDRYHNQLQAATAKTAAAEAHLSNLRKNDSDNVQALARAHREYTRAHNEEQTILARAETAYARYQNRLSAVRAEITQFNNAHMQAASHLHNLRNNTIAATAALERMSDTFSSVLRVVGQMTITGLLGGAAFGNMASMIAGAMNTLTIAVGGAMEVIRDFSALLILLPASISSVITYMGVLTAAFRGVGTALSSIDDPQKFAQALQQLAPAAQQAVITLASFRDAFHGAMRQIQQSFFQPFAAQLQPLIYQWLPELMRAGQTIGNNLGKMFGTVLSFFQKPEIQKSFQQFISNLSTGLNNLMPAIQPFLQALNTLNVVGSQAFIRLGTAITHVAERFNNWIQAAAQSGKLDAWINRALDTFTRLGHIIVNVGSAISNIFNAASAAQGRTFLQIIEEWSAKFKAWTEGEGYQKLVNFFTALKQAAAAMAPELKVVGEILGIVASTFNRLGIATAPGVLSLFTALRDALRNLSPIVLQLAPTMNRFLEALASALLRIMNAIGPQLPKIMEGFADALIELAPILPVLAEALAKLMDNLTAEDIENITKAAIAFKALSVSIGLVSAVMALNPWVLLAAAIAALVVGVIYCYNHFEGFRDFLKNFWSDLKSLASWIGNTFVNAWRDLGHIADNIDKAIQTAAQTVDRWANNVKQWGVKLITWFLQGIYSMAEPIAKASEWILKVVTSANLPDKAKSWGVNFIQKFIEGIYSQSNPLADAAKWMMNLIKVPIPGSKAKEGPFAQQSPEELGAKFVTDYAAGMTGAAPSAGAASLSVAESAAGGLGSSGGSGGFGSFTEHGGNRGGLSGFDRYVSWLTSDLSAWSQILQGAWSLFEDITNIAIQAVKIGASLWNNGDNPLTRPGGFFSEQRGPSVEQQMIPGIENMPSMRGQPPMPELVPQQPSVTQQQVPGVNAPQTPASQANPPQTPAPFTEFTPVSYANQSNQPSTLAPTSAGSRQYTGKDAELVKELKKHGFTDSQIIGLVELNRVETGNWSHPESIMGFTDNQTGPGIAAHVAGFKDMWDARQSSGAVPPPAGVVNGQVTDPKAYADWLLKLEGYSATQDWQGNQYAPGQFMSPEEYSSRVAGAYNAPTTAIQNQALQGPAPQTPQAPVSTQPRSATGTMPAGWHTIGISPEGRQLLVPDNAPAPQGKTAPEGWYWEYNDPHAAFGSIILTPKGQGPGSEAYKKIWPEPQAPQASAPFTEFTPVSQAPRLPQWPTGLGQGGAADYSVASLQNLGIPQLYTNPQQGNPDIPAWVQEFVRVYGGPDLVASSTPHGALHGVPGGAGYAVDVTGPPEQQDRLAKFLRDNPSASAMLIHQGVDGIKYGVAGGEPVGPGTNFPGYYSKNWAEETDMVHWAPAGPPTLTPQAPQAPTPQAPAPQAPAPQNPATPTPTPSDTNWMTVPNGWDISQPIPLEVRRQHGIPDSLPPMYYNAQPGTVMNVAVPPGYQGPSQPTTGNTISVPIPGQEQPGFPQTQTNLPFGAKTPADALMSGLQAAGSIVGDAFQIFDDVIQNIGALANTTDTLVRGIANTEDINHLIDNFQTFLTTAADIAKLVSDSLSLAAGIAGMAQGAGGGFGGGDVGGAVVGGLQTASAIAALVQAGIDAVNQGIDLAQMVYRQVTKYLGVFEGFLLGGPTAGQLGGNVRMLLNTRTNQILAYSEDNPLNKEVHNMPTWMARSYGGIQPTPVLQQAQVNIYAGPGQTPKDMMSESMWLISTGASSIAGAGFG